MDVPRTVREDLGRLDPDDELRLGVLGEQRVVVATRGDAVQPDPPPPLEVDEQQTDVGVDEDVPGGQVHAVPVVRGEGDRPLVEDADEARVAALVRALRPSLGVRGRDEEHVAAPR